MTNKEVAEYMGVCTETVRRWTRAGVLPAVMIARAYRYDPRDVEEMARTGRVARAEAAQDTHKGTPQSAGEARAKSVNTH